MGFCSQISIVNIDIYLSSSWFRILDEMFLLILWKIHGNVLWQSFYTVQKRTDDVFWYVKKQTLERMLIWAITDILKVEYFILLSMFVSLEPWVKLFCRPFVRYGFIYTSVFKYQYFSTIVCHFSRYDCRFWTVCCILLHSNICFIILWLKQHIPETQCCLSKPFRSSPYLFPCSLPSCFFISFSVVIASLGEGVAGLCASHVCVCLFVLRVLKFCPFSLPLRVGVGCGLWLWHTLGFSVDFFFY